MLTPNANHPDDERLSALASGDTDATADASLTGHVSTCARCTGIVDELGALRASLADLPDLRPHRPLRLLPEVAEPDPSGLDRLGGWARRFFAPMLTAGAALAMVGVIGTAAPAVMPSAQSESAPAADPETQAELFDASPTEAAGGGADGAAAGAAASAVTEDSTAFAAEPTLEAHAATERTAQAPDDDGEAAADGATRLPVERSPWPMVIFAGVSLMVLAWLLRWILVPRAG